MKKKTQSQRAESNLGDSKNPSNNVRQNKKSSRQVQQIFSQNNESLKSDATENKMAAVVSEEPRREEMDDESDFYESLSHKIRRQIIKLIGTNKTATFTEIKKATNLSTGVVYHHLEHLSKLIERDEKKRYYLTKLGEHAFRFMDINLDSIEAKNYEENISKKEKISPIYQKLSLNSLLDTLISKPKLYWPLSILILVFLVILNGTTNSNSFLFFFFERLPEEPQWTPWISPLLSVFFGILSIKVVIRVIFKRNEDIIKFAGLFAFSFIPSLLYLLFILLFFSGELSDVVSFLQIFLMLLFQVWSLIILVNLVVRINNIKLERAIFTVVLLVYFSFTVLLISRAKIF